MLLTASGSCAMEELLRDLERDDPMAAQGESGAATCGEVLTVILHGCELARRLEDDLPSIASQTHLLLLSCQEIAAAFEAAADRLNHFRPPSPYNHDLQQQSRSFPSTADRYQHNSSIPLTPQQQCMQYASVAPTPHEYQQKYCYSSPPTPPHQPNLYHQQAQSITPASSSGAAGGLLDADCYGAEEIDTAAQLLADVGFDLLNGNEFDFVGTDTTCSPDVAATAGNEKQHCGGSSEAAGCGWENTAVAATDFLEGSFNGACTATQARAPIFGSAEGIKLSAPNPRNTCPQTEGASRSRFSRKRKDSGECSQTRTIRLPAPKTGDMEAPPDDGYAWRKYGHKDILHARFPRCYYRCIHKSSCDAKKQVQRLDSDPFTYEITYYGYHTCSTLHEYESTAGRQMHAATNLVAGNQVIQEGGRRQH